MNTMLKQIVRFFFDIELKQAEKNLQEIDIIAANSPSQPEEDLWRAGRQNARDLTSNHCKVTFTGFSIEDQDND
jgi:PhoPQ-activated pathogenicity-related protein